MDFREALHGDISKSNYDGSDDSPQDCLTQETMMMLGDEERTTCTRINFGSISKIKTYAE